MTFFPVFFMWVPHADVYQALETDESQPRLRRDSSAMGTWNKSSGPDPKEGKLKFQYFCYLVMPNLS